MGILSKLFEKQPQTDKEKLGAAAGVLCQHASVTARWDNLADMGDNSKASAFVCESCGELLLPGDSRLRVGA
jgi:hypothetical protein